MGTADRQDPPRSAAAGETRAIQTKVAKDGGPQVPEEYLFRVVDAIDEVAKETGKTVPQIALNWLLQRPTVSTIVIGARNEEQLKQNLGSIGWNLTPAQVAKLDEASSVPLPYPVLASGPVRRAQSTARPMVILIGADELQRHARIGT